MTQRIYHYRKNQNFNVNNLIYKTSNNYKILFFILFPKYL